MIALFKIALFIVAFGFASVFMLIVLPVIVGLLFASPILLVNVVGYWLLPKQVCNFVRTEHSDSQ